MINLTDMSDQELLKERDYIKQCINRGEEEEYDKQLLENIEKLLQEREIQDQKPLKQVQIVDSVDNNVYMGFLIEEEVNVQEEWNNYIGENPNDWTLDNGFILYLQEKYSSYKDLEYDFEEVVL